MAGLLTTLRAGAAVLAVACLQIVRAQTGSNYGAGGAPPNAVPFTAYDSFVGTWTGKCTQTAYINPDIPDDVSCGISLNEFFTVDFTVTFGTGGQYSFSTGTFHDIGQNVSFTSARVNQTINPLSNSGTATFTDINNGGSKCTNITWADGSPTSSFLTTIVRSVPANYGIYLEEGVRQWSATSVTLTNQACPSDSNRPQYCDPVANIYSYTCYAVITLPATVV